MKLSFSTYDCYRMANILLQDFFINHNNRSFVQIEHKNFTSAALITNKFDEITPGAKQKISKSKSSYFLITRVHIDAAKVNKIDFAKILYDTESIFNHTVTGFGNNQIKLKEIDILGVLRSKTTDKTYILFEIED